MPLSVLILSNLFFFFWKKKKKKKKKNSRTASFSDFTQEKHFADAKFFILFVTEIHFKQAKIKELTNQIKSRINELGL